MPKALAGPDRVKWWAALQREVAQHKKNGTFGPPLDPKDLPPGRKAIPFDCILKLKRDGTPKVRGIMKGYRMTEGIDYNETFAPIPCLTPSFNHATPHTPSVEPTSPFHPCVPQHRTRSRRTSTWSAWHPPPLIMHTNWQGSC